MTHSSENPSPPLARLGWSPFYAAQLRPEDTGLVMMRIATVHRSRLTAISEDGPVRLILPPQTSTTDFAVGDWVLAQAPAPLLVRRLERQSLLQRNTEGGHPSQLIAANAETIFIVTSCNNDFNPARLERYLALANEAGTTPVIVLTKIDQTTEFDRFRAQAAALQRGLAVVGVNAKTAEAVQVLAPWCGPGQTIVLAGSSGVGKSTLLNTLTAKSQQEAQPTAGIREDDAKGRHTTTSRSLHAMENGGWVIDTPGMRSLHVNDVSAGLDILFAEISELASTCRFRDCTHAHEPGCAVQLAVKSGAIEPERLQRWHKLQAENAPKPDYAASRRKKNRKTSR